MQFQQGFAHSQRSPADDSAPSYSSSGSRRNGSGFGASHGHHHHAPNTAASAGYAQSPSAPRSVLAERFRTKLCANWIATESCPYEGRCMFAHGANQLRTTELNFRDGLTSEETIRNFKRFLLLRSSGVEVKPPKPTVTADWEDSFARLQRRAVSHTPVAERSEWHHDQEPEVVNLFPEGVLQPWSLSARRSHFSTPVQAEGFKNATNSPILYRWCPYSTSCSKMVVSESHDWDNKSHSPSRTSDGYSSSNEDSNGSAKALSTIPSWDRLPPKTATSSPRTSEVGLDDDENTLEVDGEYFYCEI